MIKKNFDLRAIILLLLICTISSEALHAQEESTSPFKVNRAWVEAGFTRGSALDYNKESNVGLRNYSGDLSTFTPTGLKIGFGLGNQNYQTKARLHFVSEDITGIGLLDLSLLVGRVKHFRTFSVDVNAGLGYQWYYYNYISSHLDGEYSAMGAAFEANFHFMPFPYFSLNPFFTLTSNTRVWSSSIGIMFCFGKLGYTKKQFAKSIAIREN